MASICIVFWFLCSYFSVWVASNPDSTDIGYQNTDVSECENMYERRCGNFKKVYDYRQYGEQNRKWLFYKEVIFNKVAEKLGVNKVWDGPMQKAQQFYGACEQAQKNVSKSNSMAESNIFHHLQSFIPDGVWPLLEGTQLGEGRDSWTNIVAFWENYFALPMALDIELIWDTNDYAIVLYAAEDSDIKHAKAKGFGAHTYALALETFGQSVLTEVKNNVASAYNNRSKEDNLKAFKNVNVFAKKLASGMLARRDLPEETASVMLLQKKICGILFNMGIPCEPQFSLLNYFKARIGLNTHVEGNYKVYLKNPKATISNLLVFQSQLRKNPEVVINYMIIMGMKRYALDSSSGIRDILASYYEAVELEDIYHKKLDSYCEQKIVDLEERPGFSLMLVHEIFNINQYIEYVFTIAKKTTRIFTSKLGLSRYGSIPNAEKVIEMYKQFQINSWYDLSLFDSLEFTDNHYENSRRYAVFTKNRHTLLNMFNLDEAWRISPIISDNFYEVETGKMYLSLGDILWSRRIATVEYQYSTLGFALARKLSSIVNIRLQQYEAIVQCLEQLQDNYMLDNSKLIQENYNDNLGLIVAYNAMLLADTSASDQKRRNFFTHYADMFCANSEEPINPQYAPNRLRTNVPLKNTFAYEKYFSCPHGSGMSSIHKCVIL